MPKRRANGEGNIRKRKDERWKGRYTAGYDANGKAITKNVLGKTQAEVKDKLRAAIEDSKKLDPVKAGSYTLEQWLKLWYTVYVDPQVRYSTKEFYHNAIDHHIIPKLGSVKLEKRQVLQRAAQKRARAEEKPAGTERTWAESSHGAMRSCGAE